ncbi:MAG: hypothetical protein SH850_10190 [Planctomycetaceae bacterium]|nr:hypothetical protein [Planctomycetaceae bacterium]
MGRQSSSPLWRTALLWLLPLGLLSGCSLGVMANRMFTGDPTTPSHFKAMTGTDLTKGKDKVVVICSTPTSVEADLSTLNLDILDGVSRRLKIHGVEIVSPDKVARWIDENGGVVPDPTAMANAFDADYVAWIDLNTFSIREEHSPKLLRGRTQGFVRVFRVEQLSDEKIALAAFNSEFTSTYPAHQPVSENGRSALLFQKEYIDRICDELAEKFYDHRPKTSM